MSHRTVMIGVIAAALLAVSAPALAGKGGPSGSSSTSSIAFASIDGLAAAPTLAPTPKLGDTVTFATVASGLAGWEYPMVAVSCYQDVNGDGTVDTSLTGPDVVFTGLDKPSAGFTLGGYASIWTNRGGSAVCRAELDAYGWKSGRESIRVLASTSSWLAAS
jgi:hypothetical protein